MAGCREEVRCCIRFLHKYNALYSTSKPCDYVIVSMVFSWRYSTWKERQWGRVYLWPNIWGYFHVYRVKMPFIICTFKKCVNWNTDTYNKNEMVLQMRILLSLTTSVASWEWLTKVHIAMVLNSTSHYNQLPGWTTNTWHLGKRLKI